MLNRLIEMIRLKRISDDNRLTVRKNIFELVFKLVFELVFEPLNKMKP